MRSSRPRSDVSIALFGAHLPTPLLLAPIGVLCCLYVDDTKLTIRSSKIATGMVYYSEMHVHSGRRSTTGRSE